jgi:hypothetical protein
MEDIQQVVVVRVDLVKRLVHGHVIAVLAFDGPSAQGGHDHFDSRLLQPVVADQQLSVPKIVRINNQRFHNDSSFFRLHQGGVDAITRRVSGPGF